MRLLACSSVYEVAQDTNENEGAHEAKATIHTFLGTGESARIAGEGVARSLNAGDGEARTFGGILFSVGKTGKRCWG